MSRTDTDDGVRARVDAMSADPRDPVDPHDPVDPVLGAPSAVETSERGWRHWKAIGLEVVAEFRKDQVPLISAGVAFWALLSVFPALVAVVSIYGLVADPEEVTRQVSQLSDALPAGAKDLITEQLNEIVGGTSSGLGFGAVFGIVIALWTASAGMKYLLAAINVAFDLEETRGYVKLRGLALALTLGAVVFVVASFAVIAVLPAVADEIDVAGIASLAVSVLPYVVLAGGFMIGVGVLARYGPNRSQPRWRWVTAGGVAATAVWIAASLGFSWYTANLGSYNETYGSIGAVVVLMLWLFLTTLAVVLGAELDSVLERRRRAPTRPAVTAPEALEPAAP